MNNAPSINLPCEGADLDWWAFRFVTQELTEAELSAFSEYLATNEDAQAAVAAMVDLAEDVWLLDSAQPSARAAVTSSGLPTRTASRWRRWAVWGALPTASLAVVAVIVLRLMTPVTDVGNQPTDRLAQSDKRELALTWMELISERQESGPLERVDEPSLVEWTEGRASEVDSGPPSWLLAAVDVAHEQGVPATGGPHG